MSKLSNSHSLTHSHTHSLTRTHTRVEHVRRLKLKGAKFRGENEFEKACRHFRWALRMNDKCTTCMKDLAETLLVMKKFDEAEIELRKAIDLQPMDSDALFSLAIVLSEKGGDLSEIISLYERSAEINCDDHELLYNMAIKFAEIGNPDKELELYKKCIEVEPAYGPALLNWGSALADAKKFSAAAEKFASAVALGGHVGAKAVVNLVLVSNLRANELAVQGDLVGAADLLQQSIVTLRSHDGCVLQLNKLRQMLAQVFAGQQKINEAEELFREITETDASNRAGWLGLKRVLEIQKKGIDEIGSISAHLSVLEDN